MSLPTRARRWLVTAGAALIAISILVSAPLATQAHIAMPWDLPLHAPAAAVSSFEAAYNPFGDPWSLRTAPNPSIPVALTPPCNRTGPKGALENAPPEELRFLGTSSSPLLFEECSFLFDAADNIGNQRQKKYVAALKAANPAVKYLAFAEPATAHVDLLPGTGPYPVGLADINANYEDWYVHINGQPATPANRVRHSAGLPGVFLYDITNQDFRTYMVQRIVQSMVFHGVDGVVVEQCGDYPVFEPSTPPHPDIVNRWADGCVAFLQQLKQAAPDRIVVFLGFTSLRAQKVGNPSQVELDEISFNFYVRRAEVSDGMFWEDPLGGAKASANNPPPFIDYLFARFRRVQDYAATRDNYIGVFVNTNAQNQSSFATTNPQEQHAFANYYTAAYLTMFRGAKTPLVYYTPVEAGDQFRSATHFSVWNVNVGGPLGPATQVGEARYQREFQHARVFLNGSDAPWPVSLNDRPFLTVEGQVVTSATIQPRSGVIFRALESPAACTTRSNVSISSRRGAPGTLEVTVTAGTGLIRSIQFGTARSALVDVPGGPTGSGGGFTHTLTPPTSSFTFTVRRNGGGGATVPLTVNDWCGEWRTFVGGGASAF